MNKKLKEFSDFCATTFPEEDQLDILQEECAELIQACSKLKQATKDEIPSYKWRNVKVPDNHIVIDFDKSGCGVHLHYIYNRGRIGKRD